MPSDSFYAGKSAPRLREQLPELINTEGPVADSVVFRRITRAWGLSRTGRRIEDLLKGLVPASVALSGEGGTFYWREGVDPAQWEGFRVPGNGADSKRPIEEICLEEIGNLAVFILSSHGSTSNEDLTRSVCRLSGMARTTDEAEARIHRALAHGRAGKLIQIENGIASVPRGRSLPE